MAKRANNNLQNITQKNKDRVARTQLKTVVHSGATEGSTFSAPLVSRIQTAEQYSSHVL